MRMLLISSYLLYPFRRFASTDFRVEFLSYILVAHFVVSEDTTCRHLLIPEAYALRGVVHL